ncbi:DUF805 domain-containing protein [Oricola sp.]|uniref:DUF805 domain-containing protein n=1 Tax=Oricola sp. TaxID=1979950 RepID=UPI0025F3C992|nr:DUF805 domain-containing protein [Oricola sp.]MCI5077720.1 DUF805 domain-containing protein [Oricola sp.]
MADGPDHPLTVKWVLFGFKGRIGRKSFWLAALLMLFIQGAIIARIASIPEDSPSLALWGMIMLVAWVASAWAGVALAVKRLHDLGLPGILAVALLIPAVSLIAFLILAVMPGRPETNEHGPAPFSRR